jgi:hypothetical protein
MAFCVAVLKSSVGSNASAAVRTWSALAMLGVW